LIISSFYAGHATDVKAIIADFGVWGILGGLLFVYLPVTFISLQHPPGRRRKPEFRRKK
jgi:hypothetical protein